MTMFSASYVGALLGNLTSRDLETRGIGNFVEAKIRAAAETIAGEGQAGIERAIARGLEIFNELSQAGGPLSAEKELPIAWVKFMDAVEDFTVSNPQIKPAGIKDYQQELPAHMTSYVHEKFGDDWDR